MRRKLLISILMLAASLSVSQARLPDGPFFSRFRAGVEWGYSQCFFRTIAFNYFGEEGYRLHEESAGLFLRPNGTLSLQAGYDVLPQLNVALCAGYIGMGEDNRLLPLQLRASFFPRTTHVDGPFGFAQGGPAWHTVPGDFLLAWTSAFGGGWRIALSRDCCLDVMLAAKYLRDHPRIPNPDGPGYVAAHNIRRNDAGYCALDLTIGISF